jgi:hypothetical protein
MNQQSQFKYLLYIDGNVGASRLGSLFMTKSLILIVESTLPHVWLKSKIKPYVHYVPIQPDLSDLKNTLVWCKENDSTCKKIANTGFKYMCNIMTKDNMVNYITSQL